MNHAQDYTRLLTSREEALGDIRRGHKVFLGTGCGEPVYLVEGLLARADELADVQLLHFLNFSPAISIEGRFDRRFRHNAFFVGPNTREAINQGRADYTPVFTSEIPHLFASGLVKIDEALIQVSAPDKWGYVSLGVSVDVVAAAAAAASVVIAQVNPRMPRTMGESYLHLDKITHLVAHEAELIELHYPTPDEIGQKIAANAARLIHDHDTLHIGYGQVPYAVLDYLGRRKDLGVHTEVISDRFIDLINAGVITGERKTLHPGKTVTSMASGTRRIYDYVDENPHFLFMPSEYVYSPRIISQNDNLVSIGAALQVDLSGQVCSESRGHFFYSGVGGRLDFIRGAAMSAGGRSIICLPSTTKDGAGSRIVPHLVEGAGVVATRGDIHYVVTEFGIASLKGKSIRERTMALIGLAHPAFRQELLETAKERGYVYPDQIIVNSSSDAYPYWVEKKARTKTGLEVFIRPVKPTDETLVQEMFYRQSEETIYNRFFRPVWALPHDKAQNLVNIDYDKEMAIIAAIGQIGHETILGVSLYAFDQVAGLPEVAITILDDYQGQGLGGLLEFEIARYARAKGFKGLAAVVLENNQALFSLFGKLGPFQTVRLEPDICRLSIAFDQLSDEAEAATRPPAG